MPIFVITVKESQKVLTIVQLDSADADAAVAWAVQENPLFTAAELIARPETYSRAKLSHLLDDSGLSKREFARRVLGRDVRSLARYLGGDLIPPELADQIERMQIETTDEEIVVRISRNELRDPGIDGREHRVQVRLAKTAALDSPLAIARHRLAVRRVLCQQTTRVTWWVEYVDAGELPAGRPFDTAIFWDVYNSDGPDSLVRVYEPSVMRQVDRLVERAIASASDLS